MKPSFSNLEVIKFAVGMEDMGIVFYENYAKKSDGEIRTLFLRLADDERRHKAFFQNLLDETTKEAGAFDYMFDESVTSFFEAFAQSAGFSREIKDIETNREAIIEGITTETLTIEYYKDLLTYSKEKTKETLEIIIKEEEGHLALLNGLLK